MPLVSAKCTNCGGILSVDRVKDAAICPYCGSAYIVEKAIRNYYISAKNLNADIVNVYAGNTADRMWQKVQTYYRLGEIGNAYDVMREMLKEFPEDPRPSKQMVDDWQQARIKDSQPRIQVDPNSLMSVNIFPDIYNRAVKLNGDIIKRNMEIVFLHLCENLKKNIINLNFENAIRTWNILCSYKQYELSIRVIDDFIAESNRIPLYLEKKRDEADNLFRKYLIAYIESDSIWNHAGKGINIYNIIAVINRRVMLSSDGKFVLTSDMTESRVDLLISEARNHYARKLCPFCRIGKRRFFSSICGHCGQDLQYYV